MIRSRYSRILRKCVAHPFPLFGRSIQIYQCSGFLAVLPRFKLRLIILIDEMGFIWFAVWFLRFWDLRINCDCDWSEIYIRRFILVQLHLNWMELMDTTIEIESWFLFGQIQFSSVDLIDCLEKISLLLISYTWIFGCVSDMIIIGITVSVTRTIWIITMRWRIMSSSWWWSVN